MPCCRSKSQIVTEAVFLAHGNKIVSLTGCNFATQYSSGNLVYWWYFLVSMCNDAKWLMPARGLTHMGIHDDEMISLIGHSPHVAFAGLRQTLGSRWRHLLIGSETGWQDGKTKHTWWRVVMTVYFIPFLGNITTLSQIQIDTDKLYLINQLLGSRCPDFPFFVRELLDIRL